MKSKAFLFDLFSTPEGIVLYLITEAGERLRLLAVYTPVFYLDGSPQDIADCLHTLDQWDEATVLGSVRRRDFWSGDWRDVMEVRIEQPHFWVRQLLPRLYKKHPDIEFFNADLLPEQQFCFDHQLIPAGQCLVQWDPSTGRLLHIECLDDEWEPVYTLPDLVTARLDGGGQLHGGRPRLDWVSLEVDGREHRFEGIDGAEALTGLSRLLELHDPDIIMTTGGDHFLFPLLFLLQQQVRDWQGDPVSLALDREAPPTPREIKLEGRSYFSYGRVLYQAPDYPLFGRWHLDSENSFMVEKTGIHGLIEVARVSKLPVQRIGRRSIGTGISSIQLDFAYREGFLIPWKKAVPEAWKSASQLLKTDRGGLIYQPIIGAYENVVEIDFVSMYPTIMSRFNVSPETINCRCCSGEYVPEIGYTICKKRHGLVARALAPIIAKRIALKQHRSLARKQSDKESAIVYDGRQSALKWLLVCCFGYLGYKNARFGRIEAHESVCAFSRDRLLAAREVCERRGFRVLHGIVDCFWCHRDPEHEHLGPPTAEEIKALCQEILEVTQLPISLEGVYKWITFLPSRQDPMLPVPTRYFGAFENGELKFRGIEARRSDMPPYIRKAQIETIERLAKAENLQQYRAMVPDILEELKEFERRLYRYEVPREELMITRSLSQEPDDYTSNNQVALAARQGKAAGIPLRAGQAVSYLIIAQKNRDPERRICLAQLLQPETLYDVQAYRRLLRRAYQTILLPVGVELEEDPDEQPGPVGKRANDGVKSSRVQMDLFG